MGCGLPLKTQRTRFEWGTENHFVMKREGFWTGHPAHSDNEGGWGDSGSALRSSRPLNRGINLLRFGFGE